MLTWHAFDLKSGRRGPQVTVRANPALSRVIGDPTDASIEVLAWDEETAAPVPGWDAATLAGRSMLVALNEAQQPIWGGMVVRRRDDGGPWVTCDLATLEAYLDRRFVADHTWTEVDQATIAAGLVGDAAADGIGFTIDAPATGVIRTRQYFANEDKTILSALQDLSGVINGPELTIDLEWTDATQMVLRKVFRLRNRLGRASSLPVAAFEMPGSVTGYSFVEDYSSDHGANHIIAVSDGEGDVRPESVPQVATDLIAGGWARFDLRFKPSTSITNISTLNNHAAAELAEVQTGLAELTLEAHLSTAPQVGSDFHLGDDVRVSITSPRFPEQVGPDGGLVPGYTAVMRCIGWEVDVDGNRLRPRLVSA